MALMVFLIESYSDLFGREAGLYTTRKKSRKPEEFLSSLVMGMAVLSLAILGSCQRGYRTEKTTFAGIFFSSIQMISTSAA